MRGGERAKRSKKTLRARLDRISRIAGGKFQLFRSKNMFTSQRERRNVIDEKKIY
jgi:hypothetical protein